MSGAEQRWLVYIVAGSDGHFYTGITTDMARRWQEHCGEKGSKKGAKYFRGRRPRDLLFISRHESRSDASRREYEIKQLSRRAKEQLIASDENQLSDDIKQSLTL